MATPVKAPSIRSRKSSAQRVLRAPVLQRIPWLVHAFSVRTGGRSTVYGGHSLNLGFTKDDQRERVEANRKLFLSAAGATSRNKPWPLVTVRQVHSDVIHVVRTPKPGPLVGDGMITNFPGVALGILVADCFPVLLVDSKNKAVGAFHCGWRPTAKRMVEKGLGIMRYEFGTRPQDVYAAIGPGIQSCCYEVGYELKEKFESQFAYAADLFHTVQDSDPVREKYPLLFMNQRAPGHGDPCIKLHLDLREANRRQLLALGVPEKNISALSNCTACATRKFFSHRAEKGVTGRMMAVVGIKP
ncbi:MAG TPA: peptidoglycan editing factor PgeF [Candidatus Angelobacter sp.]|nr:peptidoglycan editing factor PgeF [Candidatus Angelobacter sp.]